MIRTRKKLTDSHPTDPWVHTISVLSLSSAVTAAIVSGRFASTNKPKRKPCQLPAPMPGENHQVTVTLIDRPTESTATIAWRDPTHCCYGDQVWRACRSRVEGVCAMSGRAIYRNDVVFKPSRCRASPLNAHAMILAAVLENTTWS
ncbi:DUF3331 domain-containing protein [Caballeronia sp.]|uniref:DUF3331 domain-containing protein n=1 Tax=Caballeronia sp. TaxID=1931223 RepID=UPI003C368229